MKYNLSLISLTVLTILIGSSCSKYEENDGLDLSTKKKRLIGSWNVTRGGDQNLPITIISGTATNGSYITDSCGNHIEFENYSYFNDITYTFNKIGSGSYSNKSSYTHADVDATQASCNGLITNSGDSDYQETFNWQFYKRKKRIEFYGQFYDIIKLTDTEFVVYDYVHDIRFEMQKIQ
jgi:hypothetical protein